LLVKELGKIWMIAGQWKRKHARIITYVFAASNNIFLR
jgi:hypothetical protein